MALKTFHATMESKLVPGRDSVLVKGSLQYGQLFAGHAIVLMANHVTPCGEPMAVDEEKKAAMEAMWFFGTAVSGGGCGD